jgi:thiamine biosynthesis lipoprotein
MKRYIAILLALLVALVAMFVSRDRKRYFTHQGVVWTTDYHITYEASCDLSDSIQRILNEIDKSVSPYNKTSLITAVNQNKDLHLDRYLRILLQASRDINRESSGTFDPTVMPLVNAWGFGYKSGDLPTRAQLDSILQFVGMDKITIDNNGSIVKEDPRVMLDFSSIAKGFACDEIGRMLQRNGARNWLVEIGGEVAASGVNSRGTPWQVSVDLPAQEQDTVTHESAVLLTLDSSSVATSGNYRKWRMEQGNKLSHIIDPRTGDSRAGTLLSVTVIAGDCMTADAWATACMVMGEEQVKNVMQPRKDLGVMTISADTVSGALVVWSNAAFASRINSMP